MCAWFIATPSVVSCSRPSIAGRRRCRSKIALVRNVRVMHHRYDPRVQSLPTEAGPLSHCSQCGKRVPAGPGSPTFVYGVGAVGHQSCPACGAKWRYLWQEQAAVTKRSRRPMAVVGGLLLLGAFGAVAVVAFRGSAKQYGATSTTTKSTQPPVSSAPVSSTPGAGPAASAADFVRIFSPASTDKTSFMQWLLASASVTPRVEVDQRVVQFRTSGKATLQSLTDVEWPEPAAADVEKLKQAYGAFLDDSDLVRFGKIYSPSYLDQLKVESQAVKDAASAVRHDLGLPPTP